MKYFYANFTLNDDAQEHCDQFVILAKNLDTARKITLKKQHKVYGYDGNGQPTSKFNYIEEIEKDEAKMLYLLRVAKFFH